MWRLSGDFVLVFIYDNVIYKLYKHKSLRDLCFPIPLPNYCQYWQYASVFNKSSRETFYKNSNSEVF
jgi:hypothetical protein